MELTDNQIQALVSHGTLELPNGDVLQFTELPDDDTRVGDFDCYGKVEHLWRTSGHTQRPNGFDGMAEKIHTGRDEYWWQPPADLRSGWVGSEIRPQLRNLVRDILTYGFSVYKVELCRGTDAYNSPVVVDYATIGGIEPFGDDDDKVGYVADLVAELQENYERVA